MENKHTAEGTQESLTALDRKVKIWVVKTLLETKLKFYRGGFANEARTCFCAFGALSMECSGGKHANPSLATEAADYPKARLLDLAFLGDIPLTREVIDANDRLSGSHHETALLLKEKWGVTDKELEEFKL